MRAEGTDRAQDIMKVFLAVAFVLGVGFVIFGCGGMKYHGKYITTTVPYEPIDEFKHEGWVILAFEHPGKRPEEGEIYKFWLFKNGKKQREIVLNAKIVGTRKFFLQEQIGDVVKTHASFIAPPTYEAVKERLKAVLSAEAKHRQ
ncbi:MAG TPA: hypothetical protein ENG11_00715 [candidate division Zixibacteria bacterium]|nr:hypothetical protein [candidate division Zixibacteria bacterium]